MASTDNINRTSTDPNSRPSGNALNTMKDAVGDALDRGKSDMSLSMDSARASLGEDLGNLKSDIKRLQETFTKFASEAGGTAAGTVKDVTGAVASKIGSAAGEVTGNATDQVKTFASELELMARRNPLGTLAATFGVGVLIGMMSRGRS